MWSAAGAAILTGGLAVSWGESAQRGIMFSAAQIGSYGPLYEGAALEMAFLDLSTVAHSELI